MAVGIIPHYKEEIGTENRSPEQLLALAQLTVEQLEWGPGTVGLDKVTAFTKRSFSSWGEEITIRIGPDKVYIKSESSGSQLMDWGRNKKNVASFISLFEQLRYELAEEEITARYERLRAETGFINSPEGIVPDNTKEKVNSFFAVFKPITGYFVTPILVLANLLIFVLMCLSGADLMQPEIADLLAWGANFRPSTLDGQWWRLITCCFVHIGLIHLLLNMYALVYIGLLLEPILGSRKFLLAYLLSGLTGSLMSLWWHDFIVSAGASGAIFGMYGVFLALLTTNLIEKSARQGLLSSVLVFVAYNLLNGVKGQVDNAGHIGGLLGGLFIGYCYFPLLRNPESVKTRNTVMGAVSALILLLAAVVYISSNNDVATYTKNIAEFSANEQKALEIYNLPDQTSEKELVKKIRSGIKVWYENLHIAKSSEKLKLPEMYRKQISLLQTYCYNRINTYQALLRRVEENTDKYDHVIEEYGKQTEKILLEIELLNK